MRDDACDIHIRRTAAFELFDQLRHGSNGPAQQSHHVWRAIERLVDHSVQQILDRPSELANQLRTDHSPAALERVERSTYVDERLLILGILIPQRKEPVELLDFVLGLFNEELDELGVDLAL